MKKFTKILLMLVVVLGLGITQITFAATVTVTLQKSDATLLPGGSLRFHDGTWKTATELPDGTFTCTTAATSVTYEMTYNNGKQTIVSSATAVAFTTVNTTVALKDALGAALNGGTVRFHQLGWVDWGDANSNKELLPGQYTFEMTYNNGKQTKVAAAAPEVLFETVKTTVALKDAGGNPLTGGTVRYHQIGWVNWGDANTPLELLPGNYTFEMTYNNGKQTKVAAAAPEVLFETVKTTVALEDALGAALNGGTVRFHQLGWVNWAGAANTSMELLPGSYTFEMTYNNGKQTKVAAAANEVLFTTINTTVALKDCGGNSLGSVGSVNYHQIGWVAWGTANTSKELLPGNYTFEMTYNNGKKTMVSAAIKEILFSTTKVDLAFAGTIQYHQIGWQTFVGPKELLPGVYTFKFGTYSLQQTVSGCEFGGNVYIFKTLKANGTPLPNIAISRNDYGSHYVDVGNTDANGVLFTLNQPNGSWKFRANKNYSNQYITSGPAAITFQTAKFVAHVKHTDGTNFAGIKTEYNDYGSHWIDMEPSVTDASGKASIELFPGNFKFKALKNYSSQSKMLELTSQGTTGTVEFQTSTYVAHVKHTDGSDFEGIKTEYNDYGSHWMDMEPSVTDASGKASIELFPGNFKFKASKNYSAQSEMLELTSSGTTGTVEFQTATAVGFVRDCDLNQGVAGIDVEYNDYGSHWIDLSPSLTGADGKASIELFPGTFNLKAKIIYTSESKPITLTASGTTTQVEFNPTRVCFNYPGVVKYNDYGSHWLTMTCGTYMFPGTYKFRFDGVDQTLTIGGCKVQGIAFVHAEYSNKAPIIGDDIYYYYWPISTTLAGQTDGNGNLVILFSVPTPNIQFTIDHLGVKQSITQNIQTNPFVNFSTVKVTMKLQDHDGDGTTDDLTGNEATSLSVYRWPTTNTFGSGTTSAYQESMELLPLTYDFTMKYEGVNKTINQNVATNNVVVFETVLKTLNLIDHAGGLINLSGDATEVTYYKWPYTGIFGDGDLLESDDYFESMDLFDFNYDFTVNYKGVKKTIATDAEDITFQTKKYTLNLVDHDGGTSHLVGDAINATYYKWPYTGTFGDGVLALSDGYNESMDLFEFAYDFTIKYALHSQTINSSGSVQFQTGAVDDTDGSCYEYYKWPATGAFTTMMELLPNSYLFRFSSAQPDVTCTVLAGQILQIPGCNYLAPETKSGTIDNIVALKPVKEITSEFSYKLYPVPANSRLNVEINFETKADAVYQVFDITGRSVKNGIWQLNKGFNNNEIAVDDLVDGQYIFRLKSSEKVITEKFSVSKY